MRRFEEGQTWTYRTRSHEAESRIVILGTSQGPDQTWVWVRVTNLRWDLVTEIQTEHEANYAEEALRATVLACESTRSIARGTLNRVRHRYRVWRAFRSGAFHLPVPDILDQFERDMKKADAFARGDQEVIAREMGLVEEMRETILATLDQDRRTGPQR